MKIKDESVLIQALKDCFNVEGMPWRESLAFGKFTGIVIGMAAVSGKEWSECCQIINKVIRKNNIEINSSVIPEAWRGYFFY